MIQWREEPIVVGFGVWALTGPWPRSPESFEMFFDAVEQDYPWFFDVTPSPQSEP